MDDARDAAIRQIEALVPKLMGQMFPTFSPLAFLSVSQLRLFRKLYGDGAARVRDLAEHLGVTPGAISQLVRKLELLDLVQKVEITGDARGRAVTLTAHGRELWSQRIETRVAAAKWASADLPQELLDRFVEDLRDLVHSSSKSGMLVGERDRSTA